MADASDNGSPQAPAVKLLAEWFWTDRWTGSSAFLLPLEPRGLYREMLTQAWRRGGYLPSNPDAIRRAVAASVEEWDRCWPLVARYWQDTGDGRIFNQTQIEVLEAARAKRGASEERARRASAARWGKDAPRIAPSNAQALPEQSPPSPSPSPSLPLASQAVAPPAATRAAKPRKEPTGPQADCIRWWDAEWARTRLGTEWSWNSREAAAVAKCLKRAKGDAAEVQARMTRLLEHGDRWMAENAMPSILDSRWNQLAVEIVPARKKSHAAQALEEFERMRQADLAARANGQEPQALFGG